MRRLKSLCLSNGESPAMAKDRFHRHECADVPCLRRQFPCAPPAVDLAGVRGGWPDHSAETSESVKANLAHSFFVSIATAGEPPVAWVAVTRRMRQLAPDGPMRAAKA